MELGKYHPVVDRIVSTLEQNGCWFETFEHEEVRTSEEAAKVRHGYSLEQGAKALIVKVKKERLSEYVMLVMPAHLRIDNKKTKEVLGVKEIRFASADEVVEITDGVQPGGVPPFGNLFGLKVIVDPLLMKNERIVFNAGDRRFSVAMQTSDYVKMANSQLASVT